jgi:hypothetical protein
MDASALELDEEEHIQTPQEGGVDREEVAGDHARRLRTQKLPPRRAGAPRRGTELMATEQVSDRARRHGEAEAGELALDAPVAPARVLPRQAQDLLAQLTLKRRPSRRSPAIRPASPDKRSMPSEHGLGPHQQKRGARPSEARARRREHGTIGFVQPRAADLPPQHVKLMAKNDNLDLLRSRRPEPERDQLDKPAQRPINEGDDHRESFRRQSCEGYAPRHNGSRPLDRPPEDTATLPAPSRKRVSAPLTSWRPRFSAPP